MPYTARLRTILLQFTSLQITLMNGDSYECSTQTPVLSRKSKNALILSQQILHLWQTEKTQNSKSWASRMGWNPLLLQRHELSTGVHGRVWGRQLGPWLRPLPANDKGQGLKGRRGDSARAWGSIPGHSACERPQEGTQAALSAPLPLHYPTPLAPVASDLGVPLPALLISVLQRTVSRLPHEPTVAKVWFMEKYFELPWIPDFFFTIKMTGWEQAALWLPFNCWPGRAPPDKRTGGDPLPWPLRSRERWQESVREARSSQGFHWESGGHSSATPAVKSSRNPKNQVITQALGILSSASHWVKAAFLKSGLRGRRGRELASAWEGSCWGAGGGEQSLPWHSPHPPLPGQAWGLSFPFRALRHSQKSVLFTEDISKGFRSLLSGSKDSLWDFPGEMVQRYFCTKGSRECQARSRILCIPATWQWTCSFSSELWSHSLLAVNQGHSHPLPWLLVGLFFVFLFLSIKKLF